MSTFLVWRVYEKFIHPLNGAVRHGCFLQEAELCLSIPEGNSPRTLFRQLRAPRPDLYWGGSNTKYHKLMAKKVAETEGKIFLSENRQIWDGKCLESLDYLKPKLKEEIIAVLSPAVKARLAQIKMNL